MNSCLKLLARAAVVLSLSINPVAAAIASDAATDKYFKYPHPFQRSDGKWGYVNSNHCWVIGPKFNDADPFYEGLAGVWDNADPEFRKGFMDISGRILFHGPMQTYGFSGGLAKTTVGEKEGFIDKTGRVAITPQFDAVYNFSEDLAAVGIGSNWKTMKWGFIDKSSKFVINPQFDYAGSFREGLALVKIGKQYGFIDRAGHFAIAARFDSAEGYSDGLAKVLVGGSWGYIDKIGDFVIKPQFEEVGGFNEGLAGVKIAGKWGFIDKTGKVVINPTFDEVFSFSEGVAAVNIGGQWGFIDPVGRTSIKPQFSGAFPFIGGLASVEVGSAPYSGKRYKINRSGTVLLDPTCSVP